MRTASSLLIVVAVVSGCSGGTSIIEGTLLESGSDGQVWLADAIERVPTAEDSFRLESVGGDTIDLHFADADEATGRMRILDLPSGSDLSLRDVWIEDERAFPTAIDLDSEAIVEINGIRMARAAVLDDVVVARGILLSIADDGQAMIVRPEDERMPDLRVVIGVETSVESVDGEPASLSGVEFGDSLTVEGRTAGGYLMASTVKLPR